MSDQEWREARQFDEAFEAQRASIVSMPARALVVILLLVLYLLPNRAHPEPSNSLVNELDPSMHFPLKWRTEIGRTTFRTTLLYTNGKIIAPSNGLSDRPRGDELGGVFILDPSTGVVERHMKTPGEGDKDVNGVAVYQNHLFFGDDDNKFGRYDFSGKPSWIVTVGGDVEGAPALGDLNSDGFPDVVFATEAGELLALDGNTGALLWRYLTEWENAPGKYEYLESKAFIASPTLCDVNGDDIEDVLIGARNATFYAINGKSGRPLWKYHTGTGIHGSAYVSNKERELEIVVAEAYGTIHFVDMDGKLKRQVVLSQPSFGGAIQGLFSSPVLDPFGDLAIGTSWWGKEDGFYYFPSTSENPNSGFTFAGRISATPVLADLVGGNDAETVIVTESGYLLLFERVNNLVGRFKLPAGAEATPLVADIDSEGCSKC